MSEVNGIILQPAGMREVMRLSKDFYRSVFVCSNCGRDYKIMVRKGRRVEYLSFECPNCKCLEPLRRK